MKTENKDTIEDTEVKEVSHQEDGDFNEPKDDEFDALWDVSLSLSAIRRPGVDPGEPAPHEDDDALSVKTTSTVLDTTSDSSIEKNNFPAFGEEKVEELDKRRCCHCIKNKILIFGPLIALIAIISSVSLMSRMGIITIGSSVYTEVPSVVPSSIPSDLPSMVPSSLPTNSLVPSSKPSLNPSSSPSQNPSYLETEAIFYAIGDVPYFDFEKTQLRTRLRELPEDGEFLIHLGDIRKSTFNQGIMCQIEEYQDAHDILLESKIPVFIIPGGKTASLEKMLLKVVG